MLCSIGEDAALSSSSSSSCYMYLFTHLEHTVHVTEMHTYWTLRYVTVSVIKNAAAGTCSFLVVP